MLPCPIVQPSADVDRIARAFGVCLLIGIGGGLNARKGNMPDTRVETHACPYCLYAMERIYDGVRNRGFARSMNSTHFMRIKGLGSIKRQR